MRELALAPGFTAEYADLVGRPFELGGRGNPKFDCYGLLMELGRRQGWHLPDYRSPKVLSDVAKVVASCEPLWTPCEPGPGAVATIRIPGTGQSSHVAMVLPFDRMIHVWERSGGVCVERLSQWQHRITGYYRFA